MSASKHLLVASPASLLAMWMVTMPALMVLKMEMASRWESPCTDSPLIESISSPKHQSLFKKAL